ncbi:hypothetical protein W267_01595 [Staphylococcus aureus DAR2018]|nr:hypothetical protein AXJ01_gp140 [Staphylococcus phage SPbeta-like]EYP38800.1 hypothetical protein W221_01630 [Staphylococcus aureus DAR1275]EYP51806.1 hypothetical protein W225_02358 [Staphylococcus aureus DAR1293]EYQ57206.1 hypothetical protein W267_01595 [Staphylococcus aureus DAR2018]QPB07744.1 hypothetical protein PLKLOBMN_00173 [Staphylococcus phage PhiSepi-HH3]CAC6805984.1 phage protein [Staphylococcus aureus]VEJ61883.1 phage protein [Staphylococcus epidermidis]
MGFNNTKKVESRTFISETRLGTMERSSVQFSTDGHGVRIDESVTDKDIFIVAVEEEISEDTVIPLLLQVYTNFTESNIYSEIYENKSIKDVLKDDITSLVKTFHLVKENGEHILIWKNGKIIGE